MSNIISPEHDSNLVFQAFVLDSQIETPEQIVVTHGGKEVPFSEILAQNPDMLRELIEARAEVFLQLGWEVPHVK